MTEGLYIRRDTGLLLFEIKVIESNERELTEISSSTGIGLNLTEMKKIKEYFRQRGRNPTDVELQTIGQTWSEHCFHKTFKGNIIFKGKEIKSLFETYIVEATKKIAPKWCFSVFEDNAGVIEFDEDHAVCFGPPRTCRGTSVKAAAAPIRSRREIFTFRRLLVSFWFPIKIFLTLTNCNCLLPPSDSKANIKY